MARPAIFDAVQQDEVVPRPPARYCEGVSIARAGLSGLHRAVIDSTGVKSDQAVEAPAVQRQILYLLNKSGSARGFLVLMAGQMTPAILVFPG